MNKRQGMHNFYLPLTAIKPRFDYCLPHTHISTLRIKAKHVKMLSASRNFNSLSD